MCYSVILFFVLFFFFLSFLFFRFLLSFVCEYVYNDCIGVCSPSEVYVLSRRASSVAYLGDRSKTGTFDDLENILKSLVDPSGKVGSVHIYTSLSPCEVIIFSLLLCFPSHIARIFLPPSSLCV